MYNLWLCIIIGLETIGIQLFYVNIRPMMYTKSQRMHFENIYNLLEYILTLQLVLPHSNIVQFYFTHFIIRKSEKF
jgi:hypothetical protein